ncbi:MAG: type IV pilus assembly protein PilM [Candidatus Omnitrophica bacterium]|nr:type IV pilus assembly protein PilM [Candidatus Omnitrophota bacterium]
MFYILYLTGVERYLFQKMIKFGIKVEETVGLDIGSYAIKAVSVKKEGENNILTAYNIKKIPFGAKESDTKQLIAETFDEIDLHPEEVNLGFSGPSVIVRFIDLPKMNKEQLASALNFEAEKYIPFNVNEVVMDFIMLGDSPEAGKMRVLLAAAKKDLVESKVRLLEELGMHINILDIDSLAMFNAFMASNPVEETGSAFFHSGHSQTDMLITVGKEPCFMRQVQIGGRDIYKAISKDMDIPAEKAEELLLGPEAGDREAVERAAQSILDDIVREMQLSFGYFENRYGASVSNVYCSGGMMFQENIVKYLASKTGFELKTWNPVEGMQLADHILKEDVDRVASQLAVSIGLALRS